MQENRSFDHYFGTLQGVRGFADRATITLAGGYSVFNQPNAPDRRGRQYPWQLSATDKWQAASRRARSSARPVRRLRPQLAHPAPAWNNGKMDGWVAAKGSVRTWASSTAPTSRSTTPWPTPTPSATPTTALISATGPNRTYLWSGKIDPQRHRGSGPAYDGGDVAA